MRLTSWWQTLLVLLLTLLIFLIDAFVPVDMTIAVMYCVVVFAAAAFWDRLRVALLTATCELLILAGYGIEHGAVVHAAAVVRALVSVAAVGLTAVLALRRKRAEEQLRLQAVALRRTEAMLSGAQRLAHTGSVSWRMNDERVLLSAEAARICGFAPGRMVSPEDLEARLHAEDRPHVAASIRTALDHTHRLKLQARIILPDGEVRHVQVLAEPFQDLGGAIEYLGAVTDISESMAREHKLHEAHSQLSHIMRISTLGELTASIAHEVNQPLAAIATHAQACRRWLDRSSPNIAEALFCLRQIGDDATRAANVVRHFRTLARRSGIEPEKLDLRVLLAETLSLVEFELARHHICLQQEHDAHAPTVTADRIGLQQVLLNLLVNAIQAMRGYPTKVLHVSIKRLVHGVQVRVRDSGPGVTHADTERVFEPFFSTKGDGMGMGLTISRSIVEMHGGTIAIDTSASGCTVHFTLPFTDDVLIH